MGATQEAKILVPFVTVDSKPLRTSEAANTLAGTGVLTAAMIIAGVVEVTTTSAATVTTDTAVAIVAALPGAAVGEVVKCFIVANGANAVTLAAGVGVTLASATATGIAANTSRYVLFRLTNVTSGSEAVTLY